MANQNPPTAESSSFVWGKERAALLFSVFLSSLLPLCVFFVSSDLDSCIALKSLSAYTHTPLFTPSLASAPPCSKAMSAPSGAPAAQGQSNPIKKQFPHVDLEGNDLPPSPAPSSPHAGRRYNIATELVFTESGDQYNASSVPIYQV